MILFRNILRLRPLMATLLIPLPAIQLPAQNFPDQFPLQLSPWNPDQNEEPPAGDPYWQETVEKAIEQYRSSDPAKRRSAVMLLGKYPVPPAQETVAMALDDSDAAVRQTALVSILEEQRQIPPAAQEKLYKLLADPSLSIRRIASASLPVILSHYPFVVQPGANQMVRQMPQQVTRVLQNAFLDDDPSVRRNMVQNYPHLRIQLPQETLIALLSDPDPQVAIQSLQWALPLLSPANLQRETGRLLNNSDPNFRHELARALHSRRSPEATDLLKNLRKDPDPRVALEAKLALFNRRPDISLYEEIIRDWKTAGLSGNIGTRIVFASQMLGTEAEPFLREWIENDDPEIRQPAVQIYFSRFVEPDPDLLLKLISDPVPAIRQQVMQLLIHQGNRIPPEIVQATAESRHVDVRRTAPDLARFLKPNQRENLLLDLLLDTESTVQAAALQQIARFQIDGWEEILTISLDSENPVLARTALQWLLSNPNPKSAEILQKYIDENPRSPLRNQIEGHLRQLNRIRPNR